MPTQEFRRGTLKSLALGAALALTGTKKAQAQSLTYASWIHGHTGHLENYGSVQQSIPYGFFLRVFANSGPLTWVHYGIPTPVIFTDRRLQLVRIILRYQTSNFGSVVNNVHIWDGNNRIAAYDNVQHRGDQSFDVFTLPTPSVLWGIGVSIGFYVDASQGSGQFDFIAAGGDFTG
jgi:hypothetical protein